MKKAFVIVTIILLVLSVNTASAFFNQVKKAKKLMAAQEYSQAIDVLVKHTNKDPNDAEAFFILAQAYLYTGNYPEAGSRFKRAVALQPALKHQVVDICLGLLNSKSNPETKNKILSVADHFATTPDTKNKIGKKELELAALVSGNVKNDLLKRASAHLGTEEVYGFEKIDLPDNTVKIVFHTNKPLRVMEMKKGDKFTFTKISDPSSVKRYMPKSGRAYQIEIGKQFTCYNDFPLMLKGSQDAFITIKVE